jgi:hypothetical protein
MTNVADYLADLLRAFENGVEVVINFVLRNPSKSDPVLALEGQRHYEAERLVRPRHVQNEAVNRVQIQNRDVSENKRILMQFCLYMRAVALLRLLALVEPFGFVASTLQCGHDDIDVIVAYS